MIKTNRTAEYSKDRLVRVISVPEGHEYWKALAKGGEEVRLEQ